MPVLSTLATFSTRGFGGGSGVLVGLGWVAIGADTGGTYVESPYAIAINSINQIIVPGYVERPSPSGFIDYGMLNILPSNVGPITTKFLENTGYYDCSLNSCSVDSSDNIYCVGKVTKLVSGGTYQPAALLVKYDSTGTLLWSYSIDSTSIYEAGSGIDIDVSSSGNSYIGIQSQINSTYTSYISKHNSSGTRQWIRSLTSVSSISEGPITNIIDSSENVYTAIYRNSDLTIIKTDSNGNNVWNYRYIDTGASTDGRQGTMSIYGTTLCIGFGTSVMTINTVDGSIILQRTTPDVYGIVSTQIDSSGNIYCLTSSVTSSLYLYSYTSSGTLRYCNKFTIDRSSGLDRLYAQGLVYKNEELYISFGTSYDSLVMKVPSNGTIPGKGVYNVPLDGSSPPVTYTINYHFDSATPTIPTYTANSISLTFGTTGLDTTSYTLIDTDGDIIWTTKTI